MKRIHKLSDVQTDNIGYGTSVWQFCVILSGAVIGQNCNICAHVLIESAVIIGNNVTIKSGVQLWDETTIEDDVFIGPNVTFTNDLIPRSKMKPKSFVSTIIKRGASIGANSTIMAGNVIGEYSMVGAGSVVAKDVPPNTLWYGNPAIQKGFITNDGVILDMEKRAKDGILYSL